MSTCELVKFLLNYYCTKILMAVNFCRFCCFPSKKYKIISMKILQTASDVAKIVLVIYEFYFP